jgi:hypothetical protein
MTAAASRITVDIDSHVPNPRLRLLRAKQGLERAGAFEIEYATSSSGTGFHIVGYFDEPLARETQFQIRENLNDDPNRLRMDRQRAERGLPINTMWDHKDGNEGSRQVFETVDDVIRFAETNTQSTKGRLNAIQNRGHKAIIDEEIPKMSTITAK